jgi:hypothetical protein
MGAALARCLTKMQQEATSKRFARVKLVKHSYGDTRDIFGRKKICHVRQEALPVRLFFSRLFYFTVSVLFLVLCAFMDSCCSQVRFASITTAPMLS